MGEFGLATIRAWNGLDGCQTIIDGTTHIGARMTNAFLGNCHFKTPGTEEGTIKIRLFAAMPRVKLWDRNKCLC